MSCAILTGATATVLSVFYFVKGIISYMNVAADPTSVHPYRINEAIEYMAAWGVVAFVSILFLMAVIMRIHYLLIPTVLLEGVFFFVTFYFHSMFFSGFGFGTPPVNFILFLIFVGVFLMAMWGLIFWCTFTLYNDLRKEYIEKCDTAEHRKCAATVV